MYYLGFRLLQQLQTLKSMVSRYDSTNKELFGTILTRYTVVARYKKWSIHFSGIVFNFFKMPKNVLFTAYHFGSLVQKRMTRDEDIIYTWELFLRVDNVQSMLSMSESKAADLFVMLIFTSILTVKIKLSILPSIILASRRRRKLQYDADKESDTLVFVISAARFKSSLGRYEIHRSHGAVACAGT
jgi:hypothetical protein